MGLSLPSMCIFLVLSPSVYAEANLRGHTLLSRKHVAVPWPTNISFVRMTNVPRSRDEELDQYARVPSPYLHLPIYQHSRTPLVDKELFSPLDGTGLEQIPSDIREILLPVFPSRTPSPQPSGQRGVRILCKVNQMHVKVHKGLLGYVGLQSTLLTLGTCKVNNSSKHYLFFLYDLDQCGSIRSMIKNRVAYSNTLRYTPLVTMEPIRRVSPFTLPIVCHFNRYYYSYKIGYLPEIEMQKLFKPMKNKASFTLTPCDAQWKRLAPTDGYTVGRPMYFEAEAPSITGSRRLYIHNCHATASGSHTSTPRFTLIDNFGCVIDSKSSSRSRFIPHKKNVLRFSVDAFLFQGMMGERLYMHCEMSVESSKPTPSTKSCNYNQETHRWEELHGADSVCSCCDSKCISAAPSASKKTVTSEPWSMAFDIERRTEETMTTPLWRAEEEKHRKGTKAEGWLVPEGRHVEGSAVVEEEEVSALHRVGTKAQMFPEGRHVEGSAVVEEEQVSEPRRTFEEIFGLDK